MDNLISCGKCLGEGKVVKRTIIGWEVADCPKCEGSGLNPDYGKEDDNHNLIILFFGMNKGTGEPGKSNYHLNYKVAGDMAGLIDMLVDVMKVNPDFAKMTHAARLRALNKPMTPPTIEETNDELMNTIIFLLESIEDSDKRIEILKGYYESLM